MTIYRLEEWLGDEGETVGVFGTEFAAKETLRFSYKDSKLPKEFKVVEDGVINFIFDGMLFYRIVPDVVRTEPIHL